MKQRNIIYDLMKGIALILMMLCHLDYVNGHALQFVYSFHMPLFFILAGVFAKNIEDISSIKDYTRKNAKRLLLPYIVTMLMICAWGGIQAIAKHDISFFLCHLFSLLFASTDGWKSQWGLIYVGPMWFLIALFWVREFFYCIQKVCLCMGKYRDELVVGISLLVSVVSVLIHPYLPSLPFCIMQACVALAFYAAGWYTHHHSIPWWVYTISVLTWPFAIVYGYVELSSASLSFYPLSFIGACGGTCVIYLLCKGWAWVLNSIRQTPYIIHNTSNILSPLTWCGVYSLPILCMHQLEIDSGVYYSVMCRIPFVCERVWGGVIAIILAWIVLKIPSLKKVYSV